jgi:hypothetical protein
VRRRYISFREKKRKNTEDVERRKETVCREK